MCIHVWVLNFSSFIFKICKWIFIYSNCTELESEYTCIDLETGLWKTNVTQTMTREQNKFHIVFHLEFGQLSKPGDAFRQKRHKRQKMVDAICVLNFFK